MRTETRVSVIGLSAAGLLLASAAGASAGGAAALSDRMLDQVTAGGAIVGVSSDATAIGGVLAITNTQGNAFIAPSPSPYPGQPGLGSTLGIADGSAVAMGSDYPRAGQGSGSTTTSVVTGGVADGNFHVNSTFNRTVTGAGGVTAQIGWTVVYGAWVGL